MFVVPYERLRLTSTIICTYRKLINEFFSNVEPEAVANRKHGLFKRRWFWLAGVVEYWSIDQHDKWGKVWVMVAS